MTDRELKKLNRSELLQLLIELSDENEQLREQNGEQQSQIESLTQQLETRSLQMEQTGSIAEAALRVNGVFEAAQAAADEYLQTIREMNEKKDEDYRRVIEEAMAQADDILREAEAAKQQKIAEADAYWKETSERLDRFTKDHEWFSRLMKEKTGE